MNKINKVLPVKLTTQEVRLKEEVTKERLNLIKEIQDSIDKKINITMFNKQEEIKQNELNRSMFKIQIINQLLSSTVGGSLSGDTGDSVGRKRSLTDITRGLIEQKLIDLIKKI